MNLVNLNPEFTNNPYLSTAIDEKYLHTLPLKYFDKDGYEVPAALERLYYEAENISLDKTIQYHIAPVQEWFTDLESSETGLVLDHCMILTRYAFAGAAREQLSNAVPDRPILQKLLGIKPKYGIDFSLDYVAADYVMEVVHIEQDFDNITDANDAKQKLEQIITTTDWVKCAHDLWSNKHLWKDLSSDDQSDFKAQYFGWSRAFDNKKVFST